MLLANRVTDTATQSVLVRLNVLMVSLQTERRRLASRLDDIEAQLVRLSSAVAAQEPRSWDDAPSAHG